MLYSKYMYWGPPNPKKKTLNLEIKTNKREFLFLLKDFFGFFIKAFCLFSPADPRPGLELWERAPGFPKKRWGGGPPRPPPIFWGVKKVFKK